MRRDNRADYIAALAKRGDMSHDALVNVICQQIKEAEDQSVESAVDTALAVMEALEQEQREKVRQEARRQTLEEVAHLVHARWDTHRKTAFKVFAQPAMAEAQHRQAEAEEIEREIKKLIAR